MALRLTTRLEGRILQNAFHCTFAHESDGTENVHSIHAKLYR